MALPSLLGSGFVFAHVMSHFCFHVLMECVRGGQGTREGPPVSPCGTRKSGKASSERWYLSPNFQVIRKDISGTENSIGKGTEVGILRGGPSGEADMASFLTHQVSGCHYRSAPRKGRSALESFEAVGVGGSGPGLGMGSHCNLLKHMGVRTLQRAGLSGMGPFKFLVLQM